MKRFRAPRRPSGKTLVFLLLIVALAAGVAGVASISLRIARLQQTVVALSESLGAEIERQNQLAQYLEGNQRTATDQLSEVRRLLNLPVTSFRFPRDSRAEKVEPDPAQVFFRALDRLVLHHERQDLRRELDRIFAESGVAEPFLRDRDLMARSSGDRWIITDLDPASGMPPYIIVRTGGTRPPATVELEPLVGPTRTIPYRREGETATSDVESRVLEEIARLAPDLRAYGDSYSDARSQFLEALRSSLVQDALEPHALVLEVNEDSYPLEAVVRSPQGDRLMSAGITSDESLEFHVAGQAVPMEEVDLRQDLLQDHLARAISRLDPRPEEIRLEDQSIAKIQEMARDAGFQDQLHRFNLELATEPRETLDFHVFPLTRESGPVLGSFAVLKNSGELYLLDGEDVMITGFQTLSRNPDAVPSQRISTPDEARELPRDFPPGFRGGAARDGTDILLVGTHERKADTIILLHLGADRTISMINIPRDIYYQGRKLSYHFEIYGASTFVRRVGDIIGRSLDAYVEIDMYAFIEVVDILGGITVTLDEPLTDPTYRVRNDGVWGTLHYPAGTHTLTGIEALRIARSRATSNDFERGSRQQDILEALRRRVNEVHAGNLDQVYQLFRVLYDYVNTDLGAWEITQYFLAYRNAPIVARTGITFDNVLYATWSGLHNRGITMDEARAMGDFFLDQWILLPRGDDWNVIPWFVEENLP